MFYLESRNKYISFRGKKKAAYVQNIIINLEIKMIKESKSVPHLFGIYKMKIVLLNQANNII